LDLMSVEETPMSYAPIVPRARIGFIIPSSNRMIELQMARHCPVGVVPHFQRIGMTNRHRASLDRLLPRILEAAELLGDAKCDVTVLQCTGASMSGGLEAERRVITAIEKATGRPALSTASSLVVALAALGARRLVFVSETAQAGHDRKLAFLREAGFEILADKAVGLAGSDVYCTMPPELWYDATLSLRHDDADAYFISCSNTHSVDVIERLEQVLGKPVVTSNQVALWCALRSIGLADVVPRLGRLMTIDRIEPAAAAAE
jgi:maleate cis-trans isomerase